VRNVINQRLEWNHLANQSKALKWLPRRAVSKTAPARSLCFENMASGSRFVPLELPLDEFIEEQSNKNTLIRDKRKDTTFCFCEFTRVFLFFIKGA